MLIQTNDRKNQRLCYTTLDIDKHEDNREINYN